MALSRYVDGARGQLLLRWRVVPYAMRSTEDHLRRLVESAFHAEEPMRALETLVELRLAMDAVMRAHAAQALSAGYSFGDLARALGISRQAAHRRFRDLAPARSPLRRPRLVATEQAGQVLRVARNEAARSDAIALGSEHVLLAVLRCGGTGARVLQQHGVRVEAASPLVSSMGGNSGRAPDRGGSATGVRRVLAEAARIAVARGGNRVDVDAILLAALADPDGGARWILTALRVNVTTIRTTLEGRRNGSANRGIASGDL